MTNQEPEPAWIRDVEAAQVVWNPALDGRKDWIAELCAEETSYCEHCGAGFPMWPTKGWADHLVAEHGAALTIQARTGTSALCSDEFNETQANFIAMMFQSRVSIRRRAWKLGFVSAVPAQEKSRIHLPS